MDVSLDQKEKRIIIVTGFLGLVAATLTGAGEFLLHYDPLARFSANGYDFMLAASDERQTIGHFMAVLAAPLYVIGCWHIYLMLKPAHKKIAFIGFILSAYGFIIGTSWISSRASIGALIHLQNSGSDVSELIALYQLRYESLLNIIRITTLALSLIFIGLALTGRSHYQKWHALCSPLLLLLSSFAVFSMSPQIGKYLMPIALNIGFGLFFVISLFQAQKIQLFSGHKEKKL